MLPVERSYQEHEHQVKGMAAKRQLLLAMRIAGTKLQEVQQRVKESEQRTMKRSLLKLAIIAIAIAPVWAADDFKLPMNLEKLAEHATESVDVTLDQSTLQLASGFLSKDDPDEAQVKKMIGKLKGIYVRSFEFDKEGQYSMSDVQAMRAQLKGRTGRAS